MAGAFFSSQLELLCRYRWEEKISHGLLPNRYFIIRRKGMPGLFSYVITTLGQVEWAVQHRFVPVVDMMSYPNTYLGQDCVGQKNAWEFFFQQPLGIGLSDIKDNSRCIYSNDLPPYYPNDSMNCLNPHTRDHLFWRRCAQRYLKLTTELRQQVDVAYKNLFPASPEEKVLGVHCRGTDYTALRPSKHPVQPTPEEVIRKAEDVLNLKGYKRIFLATEDESAYLLFKKHFGDLVFTFDKNRISYDARFGFITKMLPESTQGKRDEGTQYLITISLLSRCDALIAGRTSGTVGAMLMTKGFEYQYIWDLGVYD